MTCREQILSNDYYDYITDFPLEALQSVAPFCYAPLDERTNIVYIDSGKSASPEKNLTEYQSIPKLYSLMQVNVGSEPFRSDALIAGGILQIQRQPLSLTGKNCVICIIDTGIDYLSPAFRDESGRSRILAIWDQTLQTGDPPEGFEYGTEFTGEEINLALASEDPYRIVPSRDERGHGTMMAGVAAANPGGGSGYLGAAPEADLVVVKLKEAKRYLRDFYLVPEEVPAYQENDIMLAVKYADSFTVLFERPVVICMGLGTNQGDHNGSSFLARYLNGIATKRNRAVVVCAGNEGNAAHHYLGQFGGEDRIAGTERTHMREVQIRVAEGVRGFFLEAWGRRPGLINISVRTPGGETIPALPMNSRQSISYRFVYEKSKVTVNTTPVEPSSGEALLVFRVEDPTPGVWSFFVTAQVDCGTFFDMWLPVVEFLTAPVYFLNPDPYTTMTEPGQAADVISVSGYDSSNNSIFIESGRGYSRTGMICPDIAAPGVNVSTLFGNQTGTSLSAAIAAGAVAQFLQWAVVEGNNIFVESREIKTYLIRGASQSAGLTYPNREWGYGRLNMEGVFERISRT